LHDELGQALAVIKLQVNSIGKKLKKDQGAIRREWGDTLEYIDQTIESVRRLSRDLSPLILEDLGLLAALQWMVNEFTKHHQIQVSLDLPDTDHLLSDQAQIITYRIFQETLTNIVKHAQASHVSIAIQKDDGMLSFKVEDDGKGFDFKHLEVRNITEKGLGLTTIKERVQMLGGSLDIWSQKGEGTRITFKIPTDKGETP
jgi:signal transduction histidine kinase